MSHSVKTTRSELVALLEAAYAPEDVVDLQKLNEAFAEKESEVRLELYLPSLLTSLYVLHNTAAIEQEVVLNLDSYDVSVLARVLVDYLNQGDITNLLDHNQVVLLSTIPEVMAEVLTNGTRSAIEDYDPANIRLAIQILSEDELNDDGSVPEVPRFFDDYDCTKLRLVVPTV